MNLNIQALTETDYDSILVNWWNDWKFTPPPKDFLPNNGMGGYMVYDDKIPVCAGFMYLTNSKIVWCDWIISNFKYKNKKNRKEAITFLIKTITEIAKITDKKYVFANNTNKFLINIFKENGFNVGSKTQTELVFNI